MPSIILSFVGQQDPYSNNTAKEGSIVSLVHHLLQEDCIIKKVILLYTKDTKQRALETHEWLTMEPLKLPSEAIATLPVDEKLSDDPVNLLLAVQEARRAIDMAMAEMTAADRLEFNASSGTPVLKSTWSILQAAGYAQHSRVWQVRNPEQMIPGQQRVFQTNVDTLKQEFDLRVARQQVNDYNYSGALKSLTVAGLNDQRILALLNYGHCRFALDFDGAYSAIAAITANLDGRWNQEIAKLRSKADRRDLLREAYFNALIEYHNQEYAEFLVKLSRFQEGVLRYLVCTKLGRELPSSPAECAGFWKFLEQAEEGKLYDYLKEYRFKGYPLTLQKFPNRPVLIAILEFYPQFTEVLHPIRALNEACDRRNRVIHEFEGLSQIDDVDDLIQKMQAVLKKIAPGKLDNPFDELNRQIGELMTLSVNSIGGR